MKAKKLILNLLVLLAAVAGVALLLYPHVGFWLSQRNMSYVIQDYDNTLTQMDEDAKQLQLQQAIAYNNGLTGSVTTDPFAQDAPQDDTYNSLLQMDDKGMMGHIAIPKIRLDVPIYHGTAHATLQMGIGHMQGTALPVGGAGTHSVLTGHTGLDTAKMFTDLAELAIGDEFYVYVLGQARAYQVDSITVVEPHETELLRPIPGEEYVTLVTCTPYGINSHRLLLRGRYTGYTQGQIEQQITATQPVAGKEKLLLLAGAAALLALGILLVTAILIRRHKRLRARVNALLYKRTRPAQHRVSP